MEDDEMNDEIELQEQTEAVKKGANLLDKILPGWHNQVNVKKLDMGEPTLCMMGQLFGTKVEGKLAREMYPEEYKAAVNLYREQGNSIPDGYGIALCMDDDVNLVNVIMQKRCLRSDERMAELRALDHVCSGYDTRCEWIEEIAQRKAQDGD